jgi:ABC-type branched-subunit amino acid transport system ATPase component
MILLFWQSGYDITSGQLFLRRLAPCFARSRFAHERMRKGLCLVPERRELFTEMSVKDNPILGAYTRWNVGTGCIVHSGPAADLIHDPKVIASYLGGQWNRTP